MVVPVVLAEYIAVTELQVLFTRNFSSAWRITNRYAGIAAGLYFLGVFLYLFVTSVVPLTM
jgi:hypothetical protein